jgi:hypothetical protein
MMNITEKRHKVNPEKGLEKERFVVNGMFL